MSKSKTNSSLVALLVGILMLFVGGAVLGLSLMLGSDDPESLVYTIMMYGGIVVAAVGIICIIGGIVSGQRHKAGKDKASKQKPQPEAVADVDFQLDGSATYNGTPTYVPQTESFEFVTVGRRQSLEEKFEQIGKMCKTQFVIYIAKLFSLKGYEVQLTPVIDNHSIDMIVKRDGITRAVGCLIANKVMCEEDIAPVYDGRTFYQADGVMVVTNMYFDRTSLNYAKARKISLVDRNVLTDQFIN